MEATTMEQWEDNEEMGMGLRTRLPRKNDNKNIATNSGGDDAVYSSQRSTTEAESHSTEEEEEEEQQQQKGEGSHRNGFDMVSDTNEGTESNGIDGSNGGHADFYTFEKSSGNEIVASGTQTNPHQDVNNTRLKDEELQFGSLPTKQSIEENGHHASLQNGKAGPGKVESSYISEQQASELYLERVYEKPATHEFYCPHCNTCITKVLIREREPESRPEAVPLPDPIRCTSCFSFLIPAGTWLFPKSAAKEEAKTEQGPTETKPRDSTTVTIRSDEPPIISETRDAKTFEVLKSIVYGGLAEAIASLSIVTSAASAGTTTLNILALALANLLGGLFIIGHNLWELKDDQSRITSTQTGEQVDKYEEVLGKKENFFLHASAAILSFLIFGLAPPLVYAFSFRQSNDTDLKLAAVAASSLVCIILLAIGKAYNQRPQKYLKTLVYYIIIGVGVAGVSYLAGDLIDKLLEKLGWFDSTVAGTLPLPQMSIVEPAWKSW